MDGCELRIRAQREQLAEQIAVAIIETSNTRSEKLLLGGRESLLVIVPAVELCELLRVEQVAFEGERGNVRVLQQL